MAFGVKFSFPHEPSSGNAQVWGQSQFCAWGQVTASDNYSLASMTAQVLRGTTVLVNGEMVGDLGMGQVSLWTFHFSGLSPENGLTLKVTVTEMPDAGGNNQIHTATITFDMKGLEFLRLQGSK